MKKETLEKINPILNKHFNKLNEIAITAISDEDKKQLIDDIRNDLDYDKNKLSDIDLLNIGIGPYAAGLIVDLNKEAFEILVRGVDIRLYYKTPKINYTFMTNAAKYGCYYKVESLIKNHVCSPKDISAALTHIMYVNSGVGGGLPPYKKIIELLKDSYYFCYDEENKRYYI
jgi:hypothetical protein